MSTFVLIPGAGGTAWYWSRVVPLLQAAGHDAVAVDLPGDDESAGLSEYARLVLEAIGERTDVVLHWISNDGSPTNASVWTLTSCPEAISSPWQTLMA